MNEQHVELETAFWSDPDVQKWAPMTRYLYVYLFTNSHVSNITGLGRLTPSTICTESGLPAAEVEVSKAEISDKVRWYVDDCYWVVGRIKHTCPICPGGQSDEQMRLAARSISHFPRQIQDDVLAKYPVLASIYSTSADKVPEPLRNLPLYAKDARLCADWGEFLKAAQEAYPGIDIIAQVRKAHAWEIANPKTRFLHSWLAKAHQGGNPTHFQGRREGEDMMLELEAATEYMKGDYKKVISLSDINHIVELWELHYGFFRPTQEQLIQIVRDCERYAKDGDTLKEWFGLFTKQQQERATWAKFARFMSWRAREKESRNRVPAPTVRAPREKVEKILNTLHTKLSGKRKGTNNAP